MGDIERVEVRIVTGDRARAGTGERVVLGLGGQEFELDSSANDFQRGSDRTYILGENANISDARHNNPRRLTRAEVESSPVYLRIGLGPRVEQQEESTTAGKGSLGDVLNRASGAAGDAGEALRRGIMGTADSLRTLVSSGDWNVEEATVTVHSESGPPVVYSALGGEENAWIGGRGQAKLIELTRSTGR